MMLQPAEERFDVASFQSVGARDYQEDALALEFKGGADYGITVLADGMGGHAAGDVAAGLVVESVLRRIEQDSHNMVSFFHKAADVLQDAAQAANHAVNHYTKSHPETRGMGATLVATVILNNMLFWVSVGDSPLYLIRDGEMRQLNEDHSMAPQIDFMVLNGMMDPEVGRTHPDRSALTSVIAGMKIERIDCPKDPFKLMAGDMLIQSSDGLQFLTNAQIAAVLESCDGGSAADVADALAFALDDLDDPDQDNATFAVIQVRRIEEMEDAYDVAWDFEDEAQAANSQAPASGSGASQGQI